MNLLTKLPEDIMNRIQSAKNFLMQRDEVIFAYLFGGLTRGFPNPLSDVDIAVYLSETANRTQAKIEILENLVDILLTDRIDLIILNNSSLPLSMNILKQNRILVDKKPYVRHAYQSLIMRKHFDFSRFELGILQRRFYHG